MTDDLYTQLKLVQQDVKYIREFIEEDRKRYDKHMEESVEYRRKVDSYENVGKSIKDHVGVDKWMFTTIITILLFILGKLFFR